MRLVFVTKQSMPTLVLLVPAKHTSIYWNILTYKPPPLSLSLIPSKLFIYKHYFIYKHLPVCLFTSWLWSTIKQYHTWGAVILYIITAVIIFGTRPAVSQWRYTYLECDIALIQHLYGHSIYQVWTFLTIIYNKYIKFIWHQQKNVSTSYCHCFVLPGNYKQMQRLVTWLASCCFYGLSCCHVIDW